MGCGSENTLALHVDGTTGDAPIATKHSDSSLQDFEVTSVDEESQLSLHLSNELALFAGLQRAAFCKPRRPQSLLADAYSVILNSR